MTLAEEAAEKAYPFNRTMNEIHKEIDIEAVKMDREAFINGYEQAEKDLGWHPASEHPPIDEEVIVLTDDLNTAPIYKIALGHIVDRMHCSDYNGWNIPGVIWWMPMPKLPEEKEND